MKNKVKYLSAIVTLALFLCAFSMTAIAEEASPMSFYVGNAMHYADDTDSLSTEYLKSQNDNITMEAWVKEDTLLDINSCIRIMYNGDSGSTGYGIYLSVNRPCILMGGVTFAIPSGVTLNTSQWYHIAAVRDNGVWKFYVNGTEYPLTNSTLAPKAPVDGNTFTVGNSTYKENFTGCIDEVRFWSVARTGEQIRANMYTKLQGDETGLLAYYNFDQDGITPGGDNTAISTVTDVAGGDQNLSISGFALTGDTSNFVQSVCLGTFQIENTAYSVGETSGNVSIPIVRTGGSEGSVTINYATADGTAAAGTNYAATNGSVTFTEGETSKSVQIPVTNQSMSDSKTFTFSISGQEGISIGSNSSATVTITPAEPAHVTAAEELSAAFASGGRFMLDNSIVISSPLTVPSGKTVILDLKGHTIDRGLTAESAIANGNVITVNGSLTVIDSATGGKITGGNTTGYGGGLYVGASGNLTMTGGAVDGNSASFYGGGVYVASGGSFTMSGNSAISGNSVTNSSGAGGGVYVYNSSFTMSDSASVMNNVNAGYLGGGVYIDGGTFTMSGSTVISGNSVNYYGRGGGVCVGSGSFIMSGGSISDNTASNSGGGVNVEGYGSFTMSGGSISGNYANYGGGVKVLPYGFFSMSGSASIKNNTATYEGGGINAQSNIKFSGSVEISGNTTNGSADNIRMVSYTSDTYYIKIDGALASGANICVRNGTVEMGSSGTASDIQYFHPDLANYYLFYQDGSYFKLGYYYLVTYNENGGSGAPASQKKISNVPLTLSSTMPTRSGFTFQCWNTAANTSGTSYSSGASYTDNAFLTLYAMWNANTYTVTYDPNGGTVDPASQEKLYGSTYGKASDGATSAAMPAPAWAGHTFSGWYTAASCGTKITDSDTVSITEDTTLYAQWTTNTYTVTYDANGGTVDPTSQEKLYGSTYGKASDGATSAAMPAPAWAGHTFSGWYTAASCGTKITDSDTVSITEDTTLYAKWTTNTYTVTYDPCGGTVDPASQDKLYGSTYGKASDGTTDAAMPNSTWSGHTFSGWYTAASGGTKITDSDTVSITGNTTLYAQWTTNTYTVTYDANGGTVDPTSQEKLYGSTYGKASDGATSAAMSAPKWAGHTFSGWYTAASGGTKVTDSDTVSITGNTTLYAQWTVKQYTVTFSTDGGSSVSSITQDYNTKIESLPTSTKVGYTFEGWYTEKAFTNKVSFPYSITVNVTLYAKWTVEDSGGTTPARTIAVIETSSDLFSGSEGQIKAEANMSSAFSNSVEVKVTDTEEAAAGFGLSAGNEAYPFDISLYIKGTNTKTEPKDGYAVTISLPVPDKLLNVKKQLSIMHKSVNGTISTLKSQLKQINGVWYLVFQATDFSPYALVVNNMGTYDETAGLPYYMDYDENKVFIGFAANGKYIAPEGTIVSVIQNDKSFTDIGSHWAKNYIGFVTERELFTGTGGNTFSPDKRMTRAMFVTVIGRLYERSYGEIEASSTHAFTDCDYSAYYGKYVHWATENSILGGYGNCTFGPDDPVTREQMGAILYRFADFIGVLPEDMDIALNYSDAGAISNWAQSAALFCQNSGIIMGRDGGMFAPEETATRAEVATIIERFIESVMA